MKPSRAGAKVRANAARAVNDVVARGRSLDAALADAEPLTPATDCALLRMLAYGSLRRHWSLERQVQALLERPLKRRDRIVADLLAVGLFQLRESRVPPHAAVSATVEAARLLRRPKHAALVNACLRGYLKRGPAEADPADEEATFDHPAWLIARLKTDWPDDWQRILEANNERAPMWLRVNPRRSDVATCLSALGADARPEPGLAQALRLEPARPVAELPGFAEGRLSVQDAAAQLAAPWLLAGGGRRILDACAAPGGKTAQLLELAEPGARLTALERDAQRLGSVRENLARLGLSATTLEGDAADPGSWWDGEPFDRILVDAPCTATGVIRRHPDIKLLRRETDVVALARQQRRLLTALWPLLVPGGRLLYVTCSVLAAENDQVVAPFMADHGDAVSAEVLPDYNIRDVMCRKACGYQLLPGTRGFDGFYFACLEKRAP